MKKEPFGPMDPRKAIISDHCVVRWIERRHGVDLTSLKRFVEAVVANKIGKTMDKAMVRTLENGFELRIETIREGIRREMATGEIVLHRGHLDMMTSTGHVLVLMRSDIMEWHVATVLHTHMSSGWNRDDDKHWCEDDTVRLASRPPDDQLQDAE